MKLPINPIEASRRIYRAFQRFIGTLPGCFLARPEGKWELEESRDFKTCHVTWSIPTSDGKRLRIRHYKNDSYFRAIAERQAKEFNEKKMKPWHFGVISKPKETKVV